MAEGLILRAPSDTCCSLDDVRALRLSGTTRRVGLAHTLARTVSGNRHDDRMHRALHPDCPGQHEEYLNTNRSSIRGS